MTAQVINIMNTQQQNQSEILSFEAEVKQLMQIVANSLYSNKEIVLRELISNASDAMDKLRYHALADSSLYEQDPELKIHVEFNKDARTLTVRDNGIGMNREEAIKNLGTIAESGTRAFKELMSSDNKAETQSQLIGQFGVGFYSSFVVSDKVVVRSRRAGMTPDQAIQWESDGQGEFSIKSIEKPTRGTEVILHLKKDEDDFLDPMRLRTIIRKYSDHILLPIMMKTLETPGAKKEDGEEEAQLPEWEVVNRANALWTMPKEQIKDEDYQELYKHISHDFQDALIWAHNKVEGASEYVSLLYIPARAPFDLFHRDQKRGLKLYVKRVFIMDDAEHFMPNYLRFVKGVIDANDLPLNISREILQSNRTIERIRAACVKRVLGLLEKMAEDDKEKYAQFWNEFGEVLKEGPAEDFANKERIAKLLRFSTTHINSSQQEVTLDDYVKRMPEAQEKIYYVIADSYTAAKHSPLLEVFRKKNIEVLLLSDRVDEWLVANLREYEGKQLQSISQGALDLGKLEDEETKKQVEEEQKTHSDLMTRLKECLGEKVKEVRISQRLTDSPVCVVFDENELTAHMQRLLKAAGQSFSESKPILEVNPSHTLIARLHHVEEKEKLNRWANILLSQALLAEGEQLEDPASYVKELNLLLEELA